MAQTMSFLHGPHDMKFWRLSGSLLGLLLLLSLGSVASAQTTVLGNIAANTTVPMSSGNSCFYVAQNVSGSSGTDTKLCGAGAATWQNAFGFSVLAVTTPPNCSGSNQALGWGGSAFICQTISGGSGGGTVTSVGLSVPSGIFSLSGTSPITASGTFGFLVSGISGGIPYFSDASTLTSSGNLTANVLIKGGGSVAPSPSTVADTGSGVTIGSPTGGAQGAGSLNMQGCFVNGISCAAGAITGLTAAQVPIAGSATTLTSSVAANTTINGTVCNLGGVCTTTASAASLTGTVLNSTVVTSSLTSVGTLTGGATGAGFTIALGSSTVTGTLAAANMLPLPNTDIYYGNGSSQPAATSYLNLLSSPPGAIGTVAPVAMQVTQGTSPQNALTESGGNVAVNAALGQYFGWTITGSDTLQNPTGLVAGQPQILDFRVVQDGTGGRTLAFGTNYVGSVVLNSAPNSVTTFSAFCWSTTECDLSGGVAPTLPASAVSGTGHTFTAPSQVFFCTAACTVTPPIPALGYQFCVYNDVGVSSAITLGALSGVSYANTGNGSYKSANTSLVSSGAVGDQLCIMGRDSTHYLVASYNGSWS